MKMKFTAAIALLAWLLVVGWLASMVIAKPAVLRLGNQAEDSAAMAELRNAIARNRKAMEGLDGLRGVAMPYNVHSQVVALPVAAPVPADGNAPVGGGAAGNLASAGSTAPGGYAVSMVLVANGRRSAIINGEQVRAGSRLPGGARVAAIGNDWVRIDNAAGVRQTYHVRDVFAPEAGGLPQ